MHKRHIYFWKNKILGTLHHPKEQLQNTDKEHPFFYLNKLFKGGVFLTQGSKSFCKKVIARTAGANFSEKSAAILSYSWKSSHLPGAKGIVQMIPS